MVGVLLVGMLLAQAAPPTSAVPPPTSDAAQADVVKAISERMPFPFFKGVMSRPLKSRHEETTDTGIPHTPKGLPPCTTPLELSGELPRQPGEAIRYLVDVDGMSVGTVDFKVERRGNLDGKPVTEYRSLFKLDALVATFLPVDGRAAAIVPDAGLLPSRAMDHYLLDKDHLEEELSFTPDGKTLTIKRVKNGESKDEKRVFKEPVFDFVTGFYLARGLPKGMNGCAVVYGSQRAYTIWIKPDGHERVKTPVGFRDADRYVIRYASEKSPKPLDARVWIGDMPARLPYRAEILGPHRLEAQIHIYETGK